MRKCQKCNAPLEVEDVFCRVCGTKQSPSAPAQSTASGNSSLFIKYSSYLDDNSLFNVAYAKENGIIKSDSPDEAEIIYQHLAMKNHLDSMFRYAMIQLNKSPAETDSAMKWLKLAADNGHVPSINYLKVNAPSVSRTTYYSSGNGGDHRGSADTLSGEEIYEKMQGSTVEIIAIDGKSASCSSGFLVSSTGFIVTNAHAVLTRNRRICDNINIKLGERVVPGVVVAVGSPADGKHDTVDLALIFAVGLTDSVCSDLGDSSSCRNGQKVYLIGNSLGNGTCITSGIISDAKRDMRGLSYPYIMTDAAANHGNSGGPLLAEDGTVIGVLVAGIENAEGMNYAIPINIVKEFLRYVTTKTKLEARVLGELSDISSSPETMSAFTDKLFTGIHLVVDIVAFILSIF